MALMPGKTYALLGVSLEDVLSRVEGDQTSVAVQQGFSSALVASTYPGIGLVVESNRADAIKNFLEVLRPSWQDAAGKQQLEDLLYTIKWPPGAAVIFSCGFKLFAVPVITRTGHVRLVFCRSRLGDKFSYFSLAAALERLRLRNLVVDEKLSPGETLEGATSLFEGCTPLGPNGELTEEWCVQRLQPLFLHSPTVRTRTNTMSLFGWTRSEAPAALPAADVAECAQITFTPATTTATDASADLLIHSIMADPLPNHAFTVYTVAKPSVCNRFFRGACTVLVDARFLSQSPQQQALGVELIRRFTESSRCLRELQEYRSRHAPPAAAGQGPHQLPAPGALQQAPADDPADGAAASGGSPSRRPVPAVTGTGAGAGSGPVASAAAAGVSALRPAASVADSYGSCFSGPSAAGRRSAGLEQQPMQAAGAGEGPLGSLPRGAGSVDTAVTPSSSHAKASHAAAAAGAAAAAVAAAAAAAAAAARGIGPGRNPGLLAPPRADAGAASASSGGGGGAASTVGSSRPPREPSPPRRPRMLLQLGRAPPPEAPQPELLPLPRRIGYGRGVLVTEAAQQRAAQQQAGQAGAGAGQQQPQQRMGGPSGGQLGAPPSTPQQHRTLGGSQQQQQEEEEGRPGERRKRPEGDTGSADSTPDKEPEPGAAAGVGRGAGTSSTKHQGKKGKGQGPGQGAA